MSGSVDFHTRDLILALEKEGNTYLTIRDTENPGKVRETLLACPFAIFQAHIQTAEPGTLAWAGAVLKQYGPLVQIGVNPHYVNNVIDKMVVPYGVIMGLRRTPTNSIGDDYDDLTSNGRVFLPQVESGIVNQTVARLRKDNPLTQHNDTPVDITTKAPSMNPNVLNGSSLREPPSSAVRPKRQNQLRP